MFYFSDFLFEDVAADLEMAFCACDEELQNGVDQGSDGVLSLQEFTSQICQVKTAWQLPDNHLTTARQLQDDCLMIARELLDDCITLTWPLNASKLLLLVMATKITGLCGL